MPRRGTSTGLTRTGLLYRVTQSHVFDQDREVLRNSYHYAVAERQTELVDFVLAEASRRKQLEKRQQP